jgi:hypothetical protein
MDRLSRAVASADPSGVAPVAGRCVADRPVRAWYYPTPWPPAVLAEVVTGAAAGPLPSAGMFTALGGLLRRLHDSTLPVEHRATPPAERLLAAGDRLTPGQYALAVRILGTRDPVVPVHGQPALGHVLVPNGTSPDGRAAGGTPAGLVTGWSAGPNRLGGSAALELGHLLGDMTEIAILVGLSDTERGDWLRARTADVRDGYLAAGHRPRCGGFFDRVADGALLRVLDHRATLRRLLGPDAIQVRLADRTIAHLASSAFREKGFKP